MNSKSFIFGKNYDSDYLSGRRLHHKNYDNKKDKRVKRRRRPETFHEKSTHLYKTFDNRLTLKPRYESSPQSHDKDYGLFANGKTSNLITNELIRNDKKQFKSRIREDLFWILNKKSENKRQSPHERGSTIKRTKEKETQINSSLSSRRERFESIPNKDKSRIRCHDSNRNLNLLNAKNFRRNQDMSQLKRYNKIKIETKHKPNESIRNEVIGSETSKRVMPSLPTILSIFHNLMDNYEKERNKLGKGIPKFDIDFITKNCDQIKQFSKTYKQSIEENLIQIQKPFTAIKGTVISSEKSKKETTNRSKQIGSDHSIESLPIVPYNENEVVLKEFEPKVGNMLSKMLLSVSEAFRSLSSKCVDKSFFE